MVLPKDNLINLNPARVRNRRIKVFGLMLLSTLLATLKFMHRRNISHGRIMMLQGIVQIL